MPGNFREAFREVLAKVVEGLARGLLVYPVAVKGFRCALELSAKPEVAT